MGIKHGSISLSLQTGAVFMELLHCPAYMDSQLTALQEVPVPNLCPQAQHTENVGVFAMFRQFMG
jgi:hypothetical protein